MGEEDKPLERSGIGAPTGTSDNTNSNQNNGGGSSTTDPVGTKPTEPTREKIDDMGLGAEFGTLNERKTDYEEKTQQAAKNTRDTDIPPREERQRFDPTSNADVSGNTVHGTAAGFIDQLNQFLGSINFNFGNIQDGFAGKNAKTIELWRVTQMDWEQIAQSQQHTVSMPSVERVLKQLMAAERQLFIISSRDRVFLEVAALSLCLACQKAGREPLRITELSHESLTGLDKLESQELNEHWYFVQPISSGLLSQFTASELMSVDKVLKKRNMGLLLVVGTDFDAIPAAWQDYHTELELLPTRELLSLMLATQLPDPVYRAQIERQFAQDIDGQAYLEMDLTYQEVLQTAALLANYADFETRGGFAKLREARVELLFRRWLETNQDDVDAYAYMLSVAVMQRASVEDVAEAHNLLKQILADTYEVPDLLDAISDDSETTLRLAQEKRRQALRDHPFLKPQSAQLNKVMAQRETIQIELPNGKRREMAVVCFKHSDLQDMVLHYFWAEFEAARDSIVLWLRTLLHKRPAYIGQYVSRALGIIATRAFYEVERAFVHPVFDQFETAEQKKLAEEIAEINPLFSMLGKNLWEDQKSEWLLLLDKIEMIFRWAYWYKGSRARPYIQDQLARYAQNSDQRPLYRLAALSFYGRVGAHFHVKALHDLDYIVRVRYMRKGKAPLPPLNRALIRHEEERQKRGTQTADPNDKNSAGGRLEADRQKRLSEQSALNAEYRQRDLEQGLIIGPFIAAFAQIMADSLVLAPEVIEGVPQNAAVWRDMIRQLGTWIMGYETDRMVSGIGVYTLLQAAKKKVAPLLVPEEAARFGRWGMLMYVTMRDADTLNIFCDTLRYMLRSDIFEDTGWAYLEACVMQVNLTAKDPDLTRQRAYRYCQFTLQALAFGSTARRSDLVKLTNGCRQRARQAPELLSSGETKADYRPVWKLIYIYLEAG